jgi:hypothetical protein
MADLDIVISESLRRRMTPAQVLEQAVLPWLRAREVQVDDGMRAWAMRQIEAVSRRVIDEREPDLTNRRGKGV